ncbi:hypothetical protein COU57_03035 [Candidatus Pacearchaeota archaeon CG10_big_fil_rev_8_21_14_0_10_32_14]|nr:MAG: hypothetical protein COU57_03035 [Candidatus Pacearchaeota archaeon CG10_big_fil_rev_8_21_14_0_10_32_14]
MSDLIDVVEVFSIYDVVLFDTCTLSPRVSETRSGQMRRLQEEESFARTLQQEVNNGGHIYFTEKVMVEAFDTLGLSRQIRFVKGMSKNQRKFYPPEVTYLRTKQELERLASYICNNKKVLMLSKDEKGLYKLVEDEVMFLREKYSLSQTDFDLLLSGEVLSNTRGSVAILSRDNGIYHAWQELSRLESRLIEEFGFFIPHNAHFPKLIKKVGEEADHFDFAQRIPRKNISF